MEKILVTGCSGYVGNVLCRLLVHSGYQVLGIDNFLKGHTDSLTTLARNNNFEFKYADIRNKDSLLPLIEEVDGIIHLASLVGFPACARNPYQAKSTIVDGTNNLLETRKQFYDFENEKFFVFASTGSVYGKLEDICNEDSETNPQSLYGKYKLEAEKLVRNEDYTISLRFATGMGLSENNRVNLLVNDLVCQAVLKGALTIFQADARRTFIHVFDMARSFLMAYELLKNKQNKFNVYNVGSNELNWTKRELSEYIKTKTNCVVTYKDYNSDPDQRDYAVDYNRWQNEGFKHQISMEQTIDELIRAIPMMKVENYQ